MKRLAYILLPLIVTVGLAAYFFYPRPSSLVSQSEAIFAAVNEKKLGHDQSQLLTPFMDRDSLTTDIYAIHEIITNYAGRYHAGPELLDTRGIWAFRIPYAIEHYTLDTSWASVDTFFTWVDLSDLEYYSHWQAQYKSPEECRDSMVEKYSDEPFFTYDTAATLIMYRMKPTTTEHLKYQVRGLVRNRLRKDKELISKDFPVELVFTTERGKRKLAAFLSPYVP